MGFVSSIIELIHWRMKMAKVSKKYVVNRAVASGWRPGKKTVKKVDKIESKYTKALAG